MTLRRTGLLALMIAVAATAWADEGDPPSRVARLNYMSGPVSFRPGSVEEWGTATLNYPLTIGDHLWTDAGAQSEIHIGSTGVRMAPQTAMSFLNLDDRTVQISVTQGTVNVRLRNLSDDETYEIDTPNVAITLLRPGDYRIDADGDRNITTITVHSGDAAVTGGGAAFPVHPRETARISGMDNVTQDIGSMMPPDGFDRWCQDREMRLERAQSARYVGAEMTGYEDLDEYGVWRQDPQYGSVWVPRVAVGWAPYHDGHWAWVEPWGWTWIDDAPWGFAPFHYGRWAMAGGGWVWVPGAVAARPVYAPALVAFVGGPNFRVGVGVGGGVAMAAWFPLGPHEVFRPAYHVSDVYVRQVNVTHVTNVNVINVNVTNVTYVNQRVPGAVTVVPHDALVSARPVARAAVNVDVRVVAQAQVIGTTAPVAPRRESVVVVNAGARVAAPPARFADRQVVAKVAPPPPPVSFQAKQQALQANQGRPLAPAQVNNLRGNAPAMHPMVRTMAAPAPNPGPRGGMPARGGQPQPAQQPQNVQQQQPPQRPPMERVNPPQQQPNVQQQQPVQRPMQPNDRPMTPERRMEQPQAQRPPQQQPNVQQQQPAERPMQPNERPMTPERRMEQPQAQRPPQQQPQSVQPSQPAQHPAAEQPKQDEHKEPAGRGKQPPKKKDDKKEEKR